MKKLIYIVDDEPLQLHFLQAALKNTDYEVESFSDPFDMLRSIAIRVPDAAVVDLIMPELSGVELIRRIREQAPTLPLIAVTAYPEIETAMNAVRAGANDYLKKPFQSVELQLVVERLLQEQHIRNNLESIIGSNAQKYSLESFIGDSPAIKQMRVEMLRLADMENAHILICGETGSGKSFLARVLHFTRPDVTKRLVEVNCARCTREELDAELFGWTEALSDGSLVPHPSLCEVARGGTILLDYVTHAEMTTQRRLFEYITAPPSEHGVLPCRIIATTTADPETEEGQAAFHPPLYEALSLFRIALPSLRQRGRDVLALARMFIRISGTSTAVRVQDLTPAAEQALLAYDWPGNVRELKSVIDRAIITTQTNMIDAGDLHLRSTPHPDGSQPGGATAVMSLREHEIAQIRRVMTLTKGDMTKAAQILGISRKSLWERRKRYALD